MVHLVMIYVIYIFCIMIKWDKKGFTLIELLIVIAIIAILAAVLFVSLDPLTRFRDARDSSRWQDVSALVNAVIVDQVDNGGHYLGAIASLTTGTIYMIGTDAAGCNGYVCDATIGNAACANISGLVAEGYLASIPISPNGDQTWTAGHTGYTIMTSSTGAIVIQACESENTDEISIAQ